MVLLGDFSKLAGAIGKLNELGSKRTFTAIAKNVGQELALLVDEGFEAESAPSGASWPRLKRPSKKRRGGKILQDTGGLRGSIHYRLEGDDLLVGTNLSHAVFHQKGTAGRNFVATHERNQPIDKAGRFLSKKKAGKKRGGAVAFRELKFQPGGGKIPARPFLPEDDAVLPRKWDTRIAAIIEEELRLRTKGIA